MNKKGFTLTEVIVCVAIIGVLSVIAYPAISNVVTKHKTDQYEEYEKLMVSAAKLYFESSEATSVSLATLIDQSGMSDLVIKGKTVNDSESRVYIMQTDNDGKKFCPELKFTDGECYPNDGNNKTTCICN